MRTPIALALLLAAGTAAADVYRWVDDKGVVHYSDRAAAPGAKPAQLPKLETFDSKALTEGRPLGESEADQGTGTPSAPEYQPRILQPKPDETFRDAERTIPVTVSDPPPGMDVRFVYYLDGTAQGSPTPATSYQLTGVERGEHHVSVGAVDSSGKELGRSDAVTIYAKPPTTVTPNNAFRPFGRPAPR